jgi:hypothetical protein
LLVGGSTARHRLDPEVAGRLGRDVAEFTTAAGGSVFAITSRRTGPAAEAALEKGLGAEANVHRWDPSATGNPYLAYLGSTDVLVITGESESMLAEAAVAGQPVYIYELPERPLSRKARVKNRIAFRARRAHVAARGSVAGRPLDRLCALLIETGIVRPPRDLKVLHETLIRAGVARRFGEPLSLESPPAMANLDALVRRVQQLVQNQNDLVADG